MTEPHKNLLAGGSVTRLDEDPAVMALVERGPAHLVEVVADHPSSSLCWALLAEQALAAGERERGIAAYAYARTGYHRGLDALRRSGWRGSGQIPWEHGPNRGFLRCLWALSVAAGRIGETDEAERCAQFLRDSTEQGYLELTSGWEGVPTA